MPQKVLLESGNNTYLIRHLPGIFAGAGAEVTLLSPRDQPYRNSRYVDHWIESPEDHADRSDTIKLLLERDSSLLVIITTERVFETLSAHHPHVFPWLNPDMARACQSKTEFSLWAKRKGISMPESRVCSSPEEAQEWFSNHDEAMMKVNHLGSGEGVAYVSSPTEIPEIWQRLKRPETFLMQSFVIGRSGVTELILYRGKVLAWFSSLKETTKNEFSPSLSRQIVAPKGMLELVTKIAEASGFHGLCGFDWIWNEETQNLKIIEFHPRCPSGFGFGKYAGVDVIAATSMLLGDGSGKRIDPDEQISKSPILCYFPDHLLYAIKHNRSKLVHWLPWTTSIAWRNVPFHDPKVLLQMVTKVIKAFYSR